MTYFRNFLAVGFAAALIAACGQGSEESAGQDEQPVDETGTAMVGDADAAAVAQQIAKQSLIVDTHIDVPYRLNREMDDVSMATESGDFDYPRAVAGGLNAPFMSIYTPAETEEDGTATELADHLIDIVEGIAANAPDKFAIATSVGDVGAQFAQGLISLPMGMENGAPIAGDLANLQHFYDRGVRYITLAHSKSNHIADSSYDENKRWDGLSPFGEEVVHEMNRLGIMVDISHVSDAAFYDVMDITQAPAIASHSSLRHFTPGWERNMTDEMVTRLGQNGGVIMIAFGSVFVTQAANEYNDAEGEAYTAYAEANGLDPEDFGARFDWEAGYREEHPYPFATISDVADHIDRAVELAGIDHVGIGSDFDGVGDSLPVGLKDVSGYPNLVEELLKRGYSNGDIRKILGENLMRVWSEVEAVSAMMAEPAEEMDEGAGEDMDEDAGEDMEEDSEGN